MDRALRLSKSWYAAVYWSKSICLYADAVLSQEQCLIASSSMPCRFLRIHINRLEGMHVARTCIFIFQPSVADTLHVHRNTERVISRLREILSGTSFDSELQCEWEQDICQCAASLMESHTRSTINCDELEKNGQGFMVYLGDASQHRDYFALATTACKKRNELPHGPHGDSTFHVAASQILEDIIPKSATAVGIPRNLALRLMFLIGLGSRFPRRIFSFIFHDYDNLHAVSCR